MSAQTDTPPLPHWESKPDDVTGAVVEVKRALRARIAGMTRWRS